MLVCTYKISPNTTLLLITFENHIGKFNFHRPIVCRVTYQFAGQTASAFIDTRVETTPRPITPDTSEPSPTPLGLKWTLPVAPLLSNTLQTVEFLLKLWQEFAFAFHHTLQLLARNNNNK